jgi:hypothetical protein
MFFWKRQRLICSIAILRAPKHGDVSSAELRLLRQLYAQFAAALRRIESLSQTPGTQPNATRRFGSVIRQ